VLRGPLGDATTAEGEQTPADTYVRPLSELHGEARGLIARLKGRSEFVSRLAALGFTIGAEVTVARNSGRGPLIVTLRGTRVALGRREAAKILVLDVVDGAR